MSRVSSKCVNHSHVLYPMPCYSKGICVTYKGRKSVPWVTHGKSDINQSHESLMGLCDVNNPMSDSWDFFTILRSFHHDPILSIVSKTLEKNVHQLIFQHLCIHQERPGRSTSSALLSVTSDWLAYLENGEVCSIFFELAKGFRQRSMQSSTLHELGVDPLIVIQWVTSVSH